MPKFSEYAKGALLGPLASKSFRKGASSFLSGASDFLQGTPEKRENVSLLRDEQEPLYQQLVNAGLQPGAGGAFGTSADYYRNLLSDDSADMDAFAAPELRRYQQDIVPGLAEQFAGMGAGGLSSSGFRNAQIQGATDLSERLGQIRAQLRQQGAQGLMGIGQQGLNNYSQNMTTQPGTPGLLSQLAPAAGMALGAYLGGPAGAMAGNQLGQSFGGFGSMSGNKVGANSSPYGSSAPRASPQFQMPTPRQMPTFMNR